MAMEMSGKRFGRLTVVSFSGWDKHRNRKWICQCDCGKQATVLGASLRCGNTRSCGCLLRETATTHGLSQNPFYRDFIGALHRVTGRRPKWKKDYQDRGIKVCAEWLQNPRLCVEYLSQLPNAGEPGYSLDRIDNNGNYEPGRECSLCNASATGK